MVRLRFFVEGQTEQTFADTVLKPHLAGRAVYMPKPVLVAHCRKKGKTHRGGGRRYLPIRNDILRFLRQERGQDVFFTTMIDLYGLPSGFPGIERAEDLRHDPEARVESLEQSWFDDIGDNRFIPFIQLHEFESLLFSDIAQLVLFYQNAAGRIRRLQAMTDGVDTPELIDGFETAPSKRIIREFPDYEGAKRVIGPQLAELIGLGEIRAKCPHFDSWLTRLENLAE